MTMQQDQHFQQHMEQKRDAYFQHLINKGAKVPYNFDVDKKIQKNDPSMKEEIDQLKKQLKQISTTKSYFSLDSVCPNPFDKSVDMKDFPRKIEIPQYDKYDGNGEPNDHVHQFYAMSFEFHHEDSYLMRLFPRSLKGQQMEWFTNTNPLVNMFPELIQRFVQHFAYNLS